MKGTENFKKVISAHLELTAQRDSLFAETLKKENKNIDECINYILDTVHKSGCNGFEDEEIFNMAIHYYDEDDIKDIKKSSPKVIVNHTVVLSEEEILEAKSKALEKIVSEEKQRLTAKKTITPKVIAEKVKVSTGEIQGSLF
jgi:hypothetical protein